VTASIRIRTAVRIEIRITTLRQKLRKCLHLLKSILYPLFFSGRNAYSRKIHIRGGRNGLGRQVSCILPMKCVYRMMYLYWTGVTEMAAVVT